MQEGEVPEGPKPQEIEQPPQPQPEAPAQEKPPEQAGVEETQDIKDAVNRQEVRDEIDGFKQNTDELHTPYGIVFTKEIEESGLPNTEGIKAVLKDIDTQAVNNFTVFDSQSFPGVRLTYTKLSVTPDTIAHIQKAEGDQPTQELPTEPKDDVLNTKNEKWFLFGAFGMPPDGNALQSMDMGVDRYFRLIPKVARAIKEGRMPPNVDIYMIGSGTGVGEAVTQDFIDSIKRDGLDTKGKVYAELVNSLAPTEEEIDTNHVVFQGVSMGVNAVDSTLKYLPDYIQNNSQRLLDNPAGTHNPLEIHKGAQVLAGIGAETAGRVVGDSTMKGLMEAGKEASEYLKRARNLPEDDDSQKKLKKDLAIATGIKLAKGAPMDREGRSFVRQGMLDPLSTGPKRLLDVLFNRGKNITANTKGRTLEVTTSKKHFFMYESYKRWNQDVEYAKKTPQMPTFEPAPKTPTI